MISDDRGAARGGDDAEHWRMPALVYVPRGSWLIVLALDSSVSSIGLLTASDVTGHFLILDVVRVAARAATFPASPEVRSDCDYVRPSSDPVPCSLRAWN